MKYYARIYFTSAAILIVSMLTFAPSGFCADLISSTDLIENAKLLDGKTIKYKGETVTAILNRGDNSWINLNDGSNAIGVWCASGYLRSIKHLGGYKVQGDMLEVEGVFHRACSMHGGELDIHADKVIIVKRGFVTPEKTDWAKVRLSIFLFFITMVMVAVFRKRL